MTVTPKALITGHFASNAGAAEYPIAPINPSVTATIIDKFTAYNADASSATLTVYIVPSGGSHGSSNIVSSRSIASGAYADLTELQNQILNVGETIFVLAGTANAVSIRASGREVS